MLCLYFVIVFVMHRKCYHHHRRLPHSYCVHCVQHGVELSRDGVRGLYAAEVIEAQRFIVDNDTGDTHCCACR